MTNDLGVLIATPTGRWSLHGEDITSGDVIEAYIQGHWIRIVIEHHGKGYQAYPVSVRLHHGLRARFLGEYTD